MKKHDRKIFKSVVIFVSLALIVFFSICSCSKKQETPEKRDTSQMSQQQGEYQPQDNNPPPPSQQGEQGQNQRPFGGSVQSPDLPGVDADTKNKGSAKDLELTEEQKNYRIGLVTDVGKINDKTFNQFAYEGMKLACDEFGIRSAFIETAQPTDYENNIRQLIKEGYNMIVTVGFMLGDATKKMALANPDIKFVIVDYKYDPPLNNTLGLTFAEDEAGFAVGALAGSLSKTGKVGFVGGKEIPPVIKYKKGYEAGAHYINPDIQVLSVYIDSFTDPARGKAAAEAQIAQGADIIFGAGGVTGSGAIKAAHDKEVLCIGVDRDEYFTTFGGKKSPYLISSAMKRVDLAVYNAVRDFILGVFEAGTYVGTAANGGVGVASPHDASDKIPQEIRLKFEKLLDDLKTGKITTGVS